VSPVASTTQLAELQDECRKVYVDPSLITYAVKLVGATRDPARHGLPELARYLNFGASPRATIGLIEASRAMAMLRGRNYVLPDDLGDLVPDVLRHRLALSYEALADELTADAIIERIVAKVARPQPPMGQPGSAHA